MPLRHLVAWLALLVLLPLLVLTIVLVLLILVTHLRFSIRQRNATG